jgi:hypothetical protein
MRTPLPPAVIADRAEPSFDARPEPVKQTAPEVWPAPVRQPMMERSLLAGLPRIDAARPALTVNHLNVRVINEDRHRKSEKPAPKVAPAVSAPRDDWSRFERHYLRLP